MIYLLGSLSALCLKPLSHLLAQAQGRSHEKSQAERTQPTTTSGRARECCTRNQSHMGAPHVSSMIWGSSGRNLHLETEERHVALAGEGEVG